MSKHYFVVQKLIKVKQHHIIITEVNKLVNITLLKCQLMIFFHEMKE